MTDTFTLQRLPTYTTGMYRSYSFEMAKYRAQEICQIAGQTGQTVAATEHLVALTEIMIRR